LEETVRPVSPCLEDNQVWSAVAKSDVPHDAKILSSTWAMKKKANGIFRARLNGRGLEQVLGVHCDANSIAAPVVNMSTIRIVFVLMAMTGWTEHVLMFVERSSREISLKLCTCMYHWE
jgi:Reverse transcriptase (RNA-dependent DNA polymerase)